MYSIYAPWVVMMAFVVIFTRMCNKKLLVAKGIATSKESWRAHFHCCCGAEVIQKFEKTC